MSIFQKIFWQPLFNLLILFYVLTPGKDFGVAVVLFTSFIRLILWPLQDKATRSQIILQELQPKIKELQEKYKDDKETLTKEFLSLYRGQKVNPFLGMIIIFIQLPVLVALYRVFLGGLNGDNFVYLYSFVPKPEIINTTFLGLVDLNKPNVVMAILAAVIQFIQVSTINTFLSDKKENLKTKERKINSFQRQINYFMPAILLLFLTKLPSAIALYLLTSTLFTIFQQKIIKKRLAKDYEQK